MAKIKAWIIYKWHRLVANNLLKNRDKLEEKLQKQLEITRQHSDRWTAAEKEVVRLTEILGKQDITMAMQILRERAGIDPTMPAKLDLLRQNLRQECAYILYLEELLADQEVVSFNNLPKEKREEYFQRVDDII